MQVFILPLGFHVPFIFCLLKKIYLVGINLSRDIALTWKLIVILVSIKKFFASFVYGKLIFVKYLDACISQCTLYSFIAIVTLQHSFHE